MSIPSCNNSPDIFSQLFSTSTGSNVVLSSNSIRQSSTQQTTFNTGLFHIDGELPTIHTNRQRPFLKWLGGKYNVMPEIIKVLPELNQGSRFIEPFIGAGSVFLNTNFDNYLLADANPDLINLYTILQQEGISFIEYCETLFKQENNNKETFSALRNDFNTTKDLRYKSALFIYINKFGFKGVCRYSQKGKMNTSFGHNHTVMFPYDALLAFYEKSKSATFIISDFRNTMKMALSGDIVYCDPPYADLTDTPCFTNYHTDKFNNNSQKDLAKLAEQLRDNGITVIISNHDTDFTDEIYNAATLHKISVKRQIVDGRGVGELLAVYSPK